MTALLPLRPILAGDLPLMWIRDSAVQINVLLPRIRKRPQLRRAIEGAIRAQAYFILQDPYANGYEPAWQHPGACRRTASFLTQRTSRGTQAQV